MAQQPTTLGAFLREPRGGGLESIRCVLRPTGLSLRVAVDAPSDGSGHASSMPVDSGGNPVLVDQHGNCTVGAPKLVRGIAASVRGWNVGRCVEGRGQRRWRSGRRVLLALLGLVAAAPLEAFAGQARSMAQDARLDNLHHGPGVELAAPDSLGRVRKLGDGPRAVLLIPGLGFGDGVWSDFIERHRAEFTMYAVTLAGFGGTAPLPMPPDSARFAETPWLRASLRAIEQLLVRERVSRVTVIAHWALASQIALQLALDRPDLVESVVLVSGVLKVYYESPAGMMDWTAEVREKFVEGMARQWFRTVTRQTWDDNNFMSYDYSVNPRRGLFLWREAQTPALSVWVRYLLEFYSTDLSPRLKGLTVPTLLLQPGFDDADYYLEEGRNYMRNLCLDSWRGSQELSSRLQIVRVPKSRLFMMFDQPEALDRAVSVFLKQIP